MLVRRCPICNKKLQYETKCKCEIERDKKRYRDYYKRRIKNKEEKKRQRFYASDAWIKLSDVVKRDYLGMCVLCWYKGKIIDSEYTHHIETLKDRFDLRLDKENLIPLCDICHKKVHRMYVKSVADKKTVQEKLKKVKEKFKKEYY